MIEHVIADYALFVVDHDNPVEIMEDEISGEVEPGVPKRRRDPGVHIIIIPRWRIVGDHRRTFTVIVVIDHGRVGVLGVASWRFGARVLI